MSREYRHIKEYETEILRLKEQCLTLKKMGKTPGFMRNQVHNFMNRYYGRKRKIAAGIVPKLKGRLPKDYIVSK